MCAIVIQVVVNCGLSLVNLRFREKKLDSNVSSGFEWLVRNTYSNFSWRISFTKLPVCLNFAT